MPNPYRVIPPEINLRRQPVVKPATVMTTLPQGHIVTKVAVADTTPRLVAGRLPGSGRTVRELNANALYEWLLDYGQHFGWQLLTE